MTRQEIIRRFDIDENGRIVSPGKYEREMIYTPYFYRLSLDGSYDDWDIDEDTAFFYFNVTEEDIAQFPELKDAKEVTLWEDNNGFVYCDVN